MGVIDLKMFSGRGHTSAFRQKEMADELRSNYILPIDGLCPHARIQAMRKTLQRQLQDKELHLLGSVSLYGLCPADLPGESERYPGMLAGITDQVVSLGHPRQGIKKYLGQRQPGKRLEDLCRLCPDHDSQSKKALYRRFLRRGTGSDGICTGRYHYRSLPFALSLGRVQKTQRSGKAPHATGSQGEHSYCDNRHPWQDPRSEYSRSAHDRVGSHLHHGPGLYRLHQTSCDTSGWGLLCYQGQGQFQVQTPLFSACGQSNRHTVRSGYHDQKFLCPEGLPGKTSSNTFLRQRKQQAHGVPDQQLHSAGDDHSRVVPLPLADRALLQVDQTASPDQGLLWHLRECREVPDMDRYLGVCAGGNCKEISENREQSVYDTPDSERYHFRKVAHYTNTSRFKWTISRLRSHQPDDFIRLTLGQ